MEEEKEFKIPVLGNLGLLALGYRGVEAWRKIRENAPKDHNPSGDIHRGKLPPS